MLAKTYLLNLLVLHNLSYYDFHFITNCFHASVELIDSSCYFHVQTQDLLDSWQMTKTSVAEFSIDGKSIADPNSGYDYFDIVDNI